MSDVQLLPRLQAKVTTFLAELSWERLTALADGRCRLAVVDSTEAVAGTEAVESVEPVVPAQTRNSGSLPPRRTLPERSGPAFDADDVARQLRGCETLDEATERLAGLRLTYDKLKLVAKALNISAARTKDETAKRILNLTVGARSKHAGLSRG